MTGDRSTPSFPTPAGQPGEDPGTCHAAALYPATRVSSPSFETLSALLYLVDRAHLSRYGALMFGGVYEARRHGPAPTVFLHLVGAGLDLGDAPDPDDLSPAVLTVLDETIARHGQEGPEALGALSRNEAWRSCPPGGVMTAASIAATLPNPAPSSTTWPTRIPTIDPALRLYRRAGEHLPVPPALPFPLA